MSEKTATETAKYVVGRNGNKMPVGAHPGNTGGKPGRSGRKPIWFIGECEGLADEVVLPKIRDYLQEKLPDDAGWRWAAELVVGYAKGKVPQHITLANDEDRPLLTSPLDDLNSRLARIAVTLRPSSTSSGLLPGTT